ncbi:reverse transcriptase (RNA-dependent DNA polymerase), partial [Trypanosoma vivax Y486]
MQHHRHSGVNEVVRILPCTCGRATLDARRLLLLISGDVERNPGPQIRGAQWNSGGLSQTKRLVLERNFHEGMFLLRLLQETHLASAECAALKIGGYQHVGQARTPHGGGVSILVREGVGVEVGVLEKKVPERATVTLRFSANVSLTITSAYFPRKADVSSESLDTLLGASGPLVVGADVNSHHVLWDPLRPSDDKGECIVDWCVQNDLSIANTGSATRRQPGTAALSSPDITLCRDCEISNWKSTLSPDSDHYWITFDVFVGTSLDVIAPSKPARALYAWNKVRWNDFRKLSDEFIFRRMKRSAKGADAMNEAVTRGIRMAAKRTIPKGKGVAPPFWTPELTKLDKMVQECKNERKRDALIRWRRKVLTDTALGRWKENVAKLSVTESASWNLVKSIYAPRPLTSPVLVVDGHPLTKRQQAQALAQMHMARSTKAPHAPEMKIPSTSQCTFQPITEAELDVALRELSSGTAPGDDEIHCEELKQLGRVSRRCILRLFNYSLRTGQVPAKWRQGIIVPLLKPNKPANSMASFRQVTPASTLRKLMERIVARRVRDCIEDKLQPQQAGFRPARSTLDTLMQVTSAVRRRKDGEKTAAVFIDYARAFDSVDHGCIVKELLSFGVERHLVAWIAGFLKGRTAKVRVNNVLSEDISLTCGVPQGSVLGPLLFIVTVDSLSKRLNCIPGLHHGFFADDLTIVCTSADLGEIQQTIQQGLDCVTNWSAEYYMEVSAEKTEYTLFGAREANLLSLKVGETALKEERTPKLLGLTMQPHKGLSKHVRGMKAAANTRLLQLRAVASPEWGPDREKLRAFYLALVQAKMCYGVASWWFDTSLSDRERLERVQAQAAHIVAGIPKAANREDALREARLKSINEVAHRRALEYYLRLKAKGPVHAKVADSIFPPEHPIHVRLAKVQKLYSIIDSPEKPHDATVLQWARRVHFNITTPGGLKADAPEKDKKVHSVRRVQRFRDFDYQVWTDGSVVLDVSSGAGALVYPKEGRREKVVLGAGSLACNYRAECVAMEAGLKRLVDVIELSKTHRTRVVAFTDSLSLLMALNTGPAAVEDAILRRIWDLILHIVRLRVSVNFQFVFSHCGVPRNEAADKAAEQGNAKPQSYPAWITDIVTGVERQVRNEMYRAFEEGRMTRTHRSALLDHVRPAPKHSKVDRLGESLLAQFRTGTSKHFGWLHRVLTRKMDQLECRWCSAQDATRDAAEEHPSPVTVADSEAAPDFGIATRQSDPIICPLCKMVCARRQAGVVHLVKIHGLER